MRNAHIANPKLPQPASGPRARVQGKLAQAIDLIVFDGLPMDVAAKQSGLTTYTVRQAFGRTHVIAHLKRRREVFRASVCGANVHRLAEIRDAANNIPAVQAIGMLERMDLEPAATRATQATPGLVIVVQGGVKQIEAPQRTLDVRTVENASVTNE
jgi:hypothetical protein